MIGKKELVKVITTNNYQKLNEIVLNNENINFSEYRGTYELINRSVIYRSRECFDILINHPSSQEILKNSNYENGVRPALDYFTEAPNEGNRYYVDRLINAGACFDFEIYKLVDYPSIFFQIVEKNPVKSKGSMERIIEKSIEKGNINIFNYLLNYIHNEMNDNEDYYIRLINNYSSQHNLEFIKILNDKFKNEFYPEYQEMNLDDDEYDERNIYKKYPWMYSSYISRNNLYLLSLFLYEININAFDYYYELFKNMPVSEQKYILEKDIFKSPSGICSSSYWKNYIYRFHKIIQLDINVSEYISSIYKDIRQTMLYKYSISNRLEEFERLYVLIFLLLETKKGTINFLNGIEIKFTPKTSSNYENFSDEEKEKIKYLYKKIFYIASIYGIKYKGPQVAEYNLEFKTTDNLENFGKEALQKTKKILEGIMGKKFLETIEKPKPIKKIPVKAVKQPIKQEDSDSDNEPVVVKKAPVKQPIKQEDSDSDNEPVVKKVSAKKTKSKPIKNAEPVKTKAKAIPKKKLVILNGSDSDSDEIIV
jgi:hypothetical protein